MSMLIAKARKLMDRLGYSNSHMRMLNLFVSALNWSQMLLLSALVFVVLIYPEKELLSTRLIVVILPVEYL